MRNNDPYFGIYTKTCIDFQPKVREGLFDRVFHMIKFQDPNAITG
jgi:hypothetical protein